mmetsp:Transcript_37847/g.104039  ORF Transcript_37847/g.104039 Transcript_37847/m.104039 type:complete len:283 (-) Transcript_37847:135-983(-)
MQTEARPCASRGTQADAPAVPSRAVAAAAAQTSPTSCVEAGVQASAPAVASRSIATAGVQTLPPSCAERGVQALIAVAVNLASASTQTQQAQKPLTPTTVDRSTQIEDRGAAKRESNLKAKLSEAEARCDHLASQAAARDTEHVAVVRGLRAELERLQTASESSEERVAELSNALTNKAFKQLNVTILCPRAECALRGECIEMDSWDPARLKAEFEREVLPRFTRVFVEEEGRTGVSTQEAAERIMQDFADVFRRRLSAMLSAPNAAAAYASASVAPCKGRR